MEENLTLMEWVAIGKWRESGFSKFFLEMFIILPFLEQLYWDIIYIILFHIRAFLVVQLVKNPPAMPEI